MLGFKEAPDVGESKHSENNYLIFEIFMDSAYGELFFK